MVAAAEESIREQGRFDWLLCGGRTPEGLYRLLAGRAYRDSDIWRAVHFFWGDERCVGPERAESNFNLAKRCLLDYLEVPGGNVHRIRAEAEDLAGAVAEYETELPERPGLVLLGMGADGHIASLFPHSPALKEKARRVMAVEGPVEPRRRVTITPVVLASARRILVLVCGGEKAGAVEQVFSLKGSIEQTPGRLVGDAKWFVDARAASRMGGRS